MVDDQDALADALDAPWDEWAVFLHPAQQEYVDRDFNGPARVIGSAGTGKTVVALHRAVRLASEDGQARVLLATFSDGLAQDLSKKLDRLVRHRRDVRERIEVDTLAAVGQRTAAARGQVEHVMADNEVADIVRAVANADGGSFDPDFLVDEWRLIVDAWNVRDRASYLNIPRLGRKVRMAASRRDDLWTIFEEVRTRIAARGAKTTARHVA